MLEIKNTTKQLIEIDFSKIKNIILGKHYELSLVLCGKYLMTKLSIEYKSNTKHSNVLSFPISKTEGEIFINVHEQNITLLFIHACLHLSGFKHGKAMEKLEDKYLQIYENCG